MDKIFINAIAALLVAKYVINKIISYILQRLTAYNAYTTKEGASLLPLSTIGHS